MLDCEWSDVGTQDSISKVKQNEIKNKNIIQVNSKNNFIETANRLIATIDINNCIIIDTPDTTLIAKKGSSHKIQEVVTCTCIFFPRT